MQGEILISLRSEIPLGLFLCEFFPLFLKQCSCSNNEGIPWRVFESLIHHLLKENNNNGVLEPAHTSPLLVSLPNSVCHDIIVVVSVT